MTILARLSAVAAFLACYAATGADIQSRNLEIEAQVRLEMADGRRVDCKVVRWNGFGLEGSCGNVAWTALKPATVLAVLRQLASDRDSDACADAAAIVLSLDDAAVAAKPALDWAKKAGATTERLEQSRRDGTALKAEVAARAKADAAARLTRITPEAAAFQGKPWTNLHSADVEAVSAATIEEARALLAKTGGSATLHEAEHISLLAESGDEKFVADAAFLERFFRTWRDRFEEASISIAEQGTIPIVVVTDRDRWRLLVQIAFGGDAAQHPDAVAIYPSSGTPAEQRPIVLAHPESDPSRQRYNECVGLGRAMMHLAGSAERPPAWLNEALPKVMADSFVPEAKLDAEFRALGLRAVRAGSDFSAILSARYGEGLWASNPALAQSMSYLFARWLAENRLPAVLRYAKAPRTSEGEAARFKRMFGMSVEEANSRACKWFATND